MGRDLGTAAQVWLCLRHCDSQTLRVLLRKWGSCPTHHGGRGNQDWPMGIGLNGIRISREEGPRASARWPGAAGVVTESGGAPEPGSCSS